VSGDSEHDARLGAALRSLAEDARAGRTCLVALDFDGVLAPLVDDPSTSTTPPAAVGALAELGCSPGVHLALVSGRGLEELAGLAEVPEGTWLVGSHGAERGRWVDGRLDRVDLRLEPAAAALYAELDDALTAAVDGTTARLERKPASVVLHTRTASAADRERLTASALELGSRPGVDAMQGKDVVELAVLRVTKGDAVTWLRDAVGAGTVLFAGDDVTDERAFAAMGPDDVTVKVGDGPTVARFRVAGPDEVAEMLATLAAHLVTPA
jgi:trehalose-phosphatase